VAAVTNDTDKQLAWEARHRTRAGIAAVLAALGLLAFFVLQEVLNSMVPTASGLETLLRTTQPRALDAQPSLQIPLFEYLHTHTAMLLGIGVAGFVGFISTAWTVGFLGVAARARQPGLKKFVLYLPLVGGVVLGVSVLLLQIGKVALASDFLATNQTVAQAREISNGLLRFSQILFTLGGIGLAAGLLLIALNAMRVGLLTKLFGWIGVVAGGLMLLLPPLPVVQIFFLGGLAVLFLGRWPGGEPPAWRTGRAEPWPSGRVARPAPAGPRPAARPAGAPAGARRKRKKRH
jgi:hypothetical protein